MIFFLVAVRVGFKLVVTTAPLLQLLLVVVSGVHYVLANVAVAVVLDLTAAVAVHLVFYVALSLSLSLLS